MKWHLTERLAKTIVENYQPDTSLELSGPERFHFDDRFYAWVPRAKAEASLPTALPDSSLQPRHQDPGNLYDTCQRIRLCGC